jgi:Leucine-rich repeat (LRR) protein
LVLDLNHNRLTSLPPELGKLKSLYYLRLVGNPDLAALPEEVEQLSKTRGGRCYIQIR